jgi:hypothetical protein
MMSLDIVEEEMHTPFGRVEIRSKAGAPPQMDDATIRDFSGGLNLVDDDLTIKSNYAKVLNNMHRGENGTMSVRWGTQFKYDLTGTVTGSIIEVVYFNGRLVFFTSTGQIATIDAAGTKTAIWNSTIAGALPGAPAGWVGGQFNISTTEFKGELNVSNGLDKPVVISALFVVKYLQDIPTGSNVFVPIGKYITTVADYTVIAGVPATPFEIHISAKGTAGTWAGDPDPNDGLSINIGAFAPSAGGEIRGISSFRNFLFVHFALQTVILELGIYDTDGNHTPKPSDTIPDYGVVSNRISKAIVNYYVFADERGVQKANRNQYGGAIETDILSDKINPFFIGQTPSNDTDRYKSFAVHNKTENRVMYFMRQSGKWNILVLTFDKGVIRPAWSTFTGMDFDCGCLTSRNRIFFCKGLKVYQYGNSVYANEDYEADLIGDFDASWLTATAYVAGTRLLKDGKVYTVVSNHTSGVFDTDLAAGRLELFNGVPIEFDWELPWSDINQRMKKKRVNYIGMDTAGSNGFTLQCFVDRYYKDSEGNYNPAISMDFVAGNSPGFGGGDQPFGGGRRAIDERLWGYPVEFKVFKIRISGSGIGGLRVSTFTILYKKGNYHR